MVGGSTATNHFCHNHQPKMSIIPVQEDNNGKLNPSHSCGAGPPVHKATGGHGFSNITLRTISIISK